MHQEVELKLAVSPEALIRLRRNAFLKSLAKARARRQQLTSTYFDTPQESLRQRGMALRVRRMGKRLVQTLKVPVRNPGNGLQRFLEYECDVKSGAPELQQIDDAGLQEFFEREQIASRLQPVFITDFTRTVVPVYFVDTDIEVAFDDGEIHANEKSEPICEMELELRSGKAERLYELALTLHRQVPLRPEPRTKAARAFALSDGELPKPMKSAAVDIDASMTCGEAFTAIVSGCLNQLQANEPIVLAEGDAEGVHQFRVAVRRVRALVTAFKTLMDLAFEQEITEELRWLQRALGPAREWDVFRIETLEPLRRRLPGETSLNALYDASERAQRRAYAAAHEALLDERYGSLILRLRLAAEGGTWGRRAEAGEADPLAQSVAEFARHTLSRRASKVLKIGRKSDHLTESQMHALRIEAKKLRYLAEFFAGLYDRRASRAYGKNLARIQDCLGALNDAVVGHSLLDQAESDTVKAAPERAGEVAAASAIVVGWQAAMIERQLQGFPAVWKDFRKTKAFWRS